MSGQVKRRIAGAVLAFALLGMAVEAWRLQTVNGANSLVADLLAGHDRPVGVRESQPVPVLLARALYLARHGRVEDAKELLGWLDGQGDAQDRTRANHNLGNLYLRMALGKIESGQLEQAVPLLALSKEAYRRALQWEPAFWDAKFNFEIAMRLLPEMDRVSNGDEEEPEDTRPKALWTKVPGFPRGQP